jgi:hypothetical protein
MLLVFIGMEFLPFKIGFSAILYFFYSFFLIVVIDFLSYI